MRSAQRRQRAAWIIAVGLLLALFHAAQPLGAQPSAAPRAERSLEGLGPDQLLRFADHLLQDGEYFRAITEYRRFLFTYPADTRVPMVLFRIGQAFFRGESYAEALQTFQELERRDPDGSYGQQARLWQGESLLRQAQYAAAEQIYTQFIDQTEQASLTPYAHYQRGWTFLYRRQWQEAARSWQRVPPDHPLYPPAQQLVSEAQAGERLPQKSPALAGFLSGILPGSGQLYNGRRGDALLAFLLNGLFIAGTIEAIDQGELAVAGVLSFFGAGWYVGNVYGAMNGAHKHNRHATETMLMQLEQRFRIPPPGEKVSRSEIGLRISFGF